MTSKIDIKWRQSFLERDMVKVMVNPQIMHHNDHFNWVRIHRYTNIGTLALGCLVSKLKKGLKEGWADEGDWARQHREEVVTTPFKGMHKFFKMLSGGLTFSTLPIAGCLHCRGGWCQPQVKHEEVVSSLVIGEGGKRERMRMVF